MELDPSPPATYTAKQGMPWVSLKHPPAHRISASDDGCGCVGFGCCVCGRCRWRKWTPERDLIWRNILKLEYSKNIDIKVGSQKDLRLKIGHDVYFKHHNLHMNNVHLKYAWSCSLRDCVIIYLHPPAAHVSSSYIFIYCNDHNREEHPSSIPSPQAPPRNSALYGSSRSFCWSWNAWNCHRCLPILE